MRPVVDTPARPRDETTQRPAMDFSQWWQRAAELVGLPIQNTPGELSLVGADLSLLLKRLNALDTPHRALLLGMACLANPARADWLQAWTGFHFGQLTAAELGPEVFQVLVGLLATFHTKPSTE